MRIEKYLDFRFRNFVLIREKEIADYYKDVYVPRLEEVRQDKLFRRWKKPSRNRANLD